MKEKVCTLVLKMNMDGALLLRSVLAGASIMFIASRSSRNLSDFMEELINSLNNAIEGMEELEDE